MNKEKESLNIFTLFSLNELHLIGKKTEGLCLIEKGLPNRFVMVLAL